MRVTPAALVVVLAANDALLLWYLDASVPESLLLVGVTCLLVAPAALLATGLRDDEPSRRELQEAVDGLRERVDDLES